MSIRNSTWKEGLPSCAIVIKPFSVKYNSDYTARVKPLSPFINVCFGLYLDRFPIKSL